jgi:SAM-dependent methyltransferase
VRKLGFGEVVRFAVGLPLSIIYFPIMILTVLAYVLMPRSLVARLQEANRAKEIAARIKAMRQFVYDGEKVLDFGAGRGDFLKNVAQDFSVEIIGIDIIDYTDDDVEVLMFDGDRIPLPDKSVDVGMAAFVLHHIVDQERAVSELVRVCRSRIIIFEDTFFTPWQRVFVAWNDYYANILMGSIRAWKSLGKFTIAQMPMPLTFRSVRGWSAFFASHGLAAKSIQVRHNSVKPMSKVTFVLEVAPQDLRASAEDESTCPSPAFV